MRVSGTVGEVILDEDVLKALSLTGQALRFETPARPTQFSEEPSIRDDRRIAPNSVRRPLVRLLTGKRVTEHVALALAWTLDSLRIRPHPFDLPKLEDFVRAHAEYLGATAQHWARRHDDPGAPQPDYFAPDELDENTWSSATPSRRARFIEERRKLDPDAALKLAESVWTQQDPDARVKLLMALRTGLGPGDQSFLGGLEKDRAPRVRALAQRLLSRLAGTAGENPALRACVERIRRSETGLIKKRTVLTIELPATVKENTARSWIRETFAEISCDELARSLGLPELQMIEGAAKDQNLLLGLAWMATQDARLELLEAIVGHHLSDAWEQMSLSGPLDLSLMSEEERMQWAEILTRPHWRKPPVVFAAWSWLHRALRGPVPKQLMEAVVRSPNWIGDLLEGEKNGPEWPEILAACCPSTQRVDLRKQLGAVDPSLTLTAIPLMDILDTLEKA